MHRLARLLPLLCLHAWVVCDAQGIDIHGELRAKNFIQLENRLSDVETELAKGQLGEYEALEAYKPLYRRDDVLSNELDGWVRHSPGSYVAYLAKATYHRKLGDQWRGTEYIQRVPAANVLLMRQEFESAKKDLTKALELNARSYLAILNLMNIAMHEGDDQEAKKLLRMAIKIRPKNLLVRARYMVHLQPRWGGSFERMERFVTDSRSSGAPQDVVNLLSAIQFEDLGFTKEAAGDLISAKNSYLRVLALSRGADERFIVTYLPHSAFWCRKNC